MISRVLHTLRRAIEGAKTAIVALLFVQYRPFYPPAPSVQTKERLFTAGPGALTGENEFMFNYHMMASSLISLKYPSFEYRMPILKAYLPNVGYLISKLGVKLSLEISLMHYLDFQDNC